MPKSALRSYFPIIELIFFENHGEFYALCWTIAVKHLEMQDKNALSSLLVS